MKAEKEILGTGKDMPFIFDPARGRAEGHFSDRHYKASPGGTSIYSPGDVHNDFAGAQSISYFTFRFRPDELRKASLDFPRKHKG